VSDGTGQARPAIDPSTSVDEARREVEGWIAENVPVEWIAALQRGGPDALRRVRSTRDYEQWYRVFAESGLVVATWPEEYGGLGVSNAVARAIDDVLARHRLGKLNPLGLNLAGPTLLQWGSDAQRRRFLLPLVRNEERWCQLFSEPGAGSDLASLATRATRDGESWRLTGQKVWSTWAHESQFGLTLARTDDAVPKRAGITYFIVAMDAPGVTVKPLRQMTGEADFNEVFLDDVVVADASRVGGIGDGWRVANATLSGERQMISGAGGGGVDRIGGRSIERLIERARELGARGEPRVHGELGWGDARVRQRLAVLYARGRALAWTNARARDARRAGRQPGPESSIGKLMNAEHNQALQEAWIDLLGVRAIAHDATDDDAESVARGFLRSRANTIEGGTSEVQRTILGERVLGLPREPDPFHDAPWSQVPR
jgi:alkylation response protein AidB-like acyl-CoA dehydrogenase